MTRLFIPAVALAAVLGGAGLRAQGQPQNPPPQQPPAKPPAEVIDPKVIPPPPPEEPKFDPTRAEKSIEVGLFYMKKHDYDAAIERFQDAANAKSNFARPYELLGEAYEKKGMKAEAVKSYEAFIKIVPRSPDAERLRRRIAKLNEEIARETHHRPS